MIARGDLVVEANYMGVDVFIVQGDEGHDALSLDRDAALWLMHTALPAALQSVPSDPPVKIRDASNDEGQIAGQLALE